MKTQALNMIVMDAQDNVGIALKPIAARDRASDAAERTIEACEDIPPGHKIALRRIEDGEAIVRLGMPVGIAKAAIAPGCLVHIHNVRSQYLDNAEDHYE